jgi:hypothetical protein
MIDGERRGERKRRGEEGDTHFVNLICAVSKTANRWKITNLHHAK